MADEMHDTTFIGWIFSCVNLTTLKLTFPFTGKCYKILKRIGITTVLAEDESTILSSSCLIYKKNVLLW